MRLDLVEKKANELLKQYDLDNLPINVEALARKLNINIVEEDFEGSLSGVLYRDDDNVVIGVNAKHAEKRKRFTIAHEIGHFILHKGNKMHIDREYKVNFRDSISSTATNREEIEANAFAASLLMPENKFMMEVINLVDTGKDVINDDEVVRELANKFNVSQQALLIRLGKLLK